MKRLCLILFAVLLANFSGSQVLAQKDRLQGRWEGKVKTPQGEQNATINIRKDGETYKGSVVGLRGGFEIPIKDIKIEGDKVTAKTEIQTPQSALVVNYDLILKDETMKGRGALNFGLQVINFDFDLKRVSDTPAPAGQSSGGQGGRQRDTVEQPLQKQSIDYFVGQWNFTWLGRESAFGPGGTRQGTVTFTKNPDGKSVQIRTEYKADTSTLQTTGTLTFDDATKAVTITEQFAGGLRIESQGDWRSPLAVRCTFQSVKVNSQTLTLKRTMNIISAHSFTLVEELSEDGGPFVRLGSGTFTRASAAKN